MAKRERTKTKAQKLTLEQKAAKAMKERLSNATQATKTGDGIAADMFIRPQNMNVSFDFEQWFEKDDAHPQGGAWIRVRRGRRTNNVYDTLYKAKTIDKAGKVSGDDLASLYAMSKGLQGSPDEGFERVQCDRADPHVLAMRRAEYGDKFADVLRRVDNTRYRRILRALTTDLVMGDGSGNQGDGARWRSVISVTVGLSSDKAQSRAVKIAVEMLVEAIDGHEREWTRLKRERKERLLKAA